MALLWEIILYSAMIMGYEIIYYTSERFPPLVLLNMSHTYFRQDVSYQLSDRNQAHFVCKSET